MKIAPYESHKFDSPAKMTYREAFAAHMGSIVQTVGIFSPRIGKREALSLLKRHTENEARRQGRLAAARLGTNDFEAFKSCMKEMTPLQQKTLTWEIVEDSPDRFCMKVTECLCAQAYRKLNAGDIGYAHECSSDSAFCIGFNKKIRLIRQETIMQGSKRCLLCWSIEGTNQNPTKSIDAKPEPERH